MLQALLLDLDGVLVDSTRVHAAAWQALFAPLGVEFGWDRYRTQANGRSRGDVIRAILGPRPDHEQLMRRKAELVRDLLRERGCPTVPGARQLLQTARARGIPTAIATASRMPGPFLHAAGLADVAPMTVDRTHVDHGKPAPDVYLLAAARLGVDPHRCLVVEDSPAGLRAGRAAGCVTVGITTHHPAAQLDADHVIDHLEQIWTLWEELTSATDATP